MSLGCCHTLLLHKHLLSSGNKCTLTGCAVHQCVGPIMLSFIKFLESRLRNISNYYCYYYLKALL